MAQLKLDLSTALKDRSHEPVDLIIHISGEMSALEPLLAQRGVEVRRQFRLTRALSIRCNGSVALSLAKEPWVSRMELDRPVNALRR
jgi:hypothetical protein